MIEKADEEVTKWARAVLPTVDVTLGPPVQESDAPAVSLHLLELSHLPPARGAGPVGMQASARYVVTTAAADAETAHRLLGTLLFAAMERPDFDVGYHPVPPGLWAGAEVIPRAAFTLGVRLRIEPHVDPVPLVRGPLVVNGTPIGPLVGTVVGPGDIPVADAFIRLPALSASTRSDHRGRFRFATVPYGVPTDILVRAKASEFPFTIASPPDSEPVVLRLALSEA